MNNYSKAGTGMAIVTVMELVLPMLGIEAPAGSVAAVVDSFVTLAGFALMVYGQIDRDDLKMGLFRQ